MSGTNRISTLYDYHGAFLRRAGAGAPAPQQPPVASEIVIEVKPDETANTAPPQQFVVTPGSRR